MKINPVIPVWILLIILIALIGLFSYRLYKLNIDNKKKIYPFIRILIITILIFLINLRIMRPTYTKDALLKNIDVLFVVDNTISMYAEDNNRETRMENVQKDAEHIMDMLEGGNFALIRFDNKSQILSPFTQDKRNILDALTVITFPDVSYASGTSLNIAYDDMQTLLQSSNQKDNKMTILFFISDGEITDDSTLISFKDLATYIDGGAVLGYGSEEGGKMLVGDSYFSYYLQDNTSYEDAISKIDKANLKQIADDLGLPVFFMNDNPNIDSLLNTIISDSSTYIGATNTIDYEDTYYFYTYPLIALLVLEIYLYFRKGIV